MKRISTSRSGMIGVFNAALRRISAKLGRVKDGNRAFGDGVTASAEASFDADFYLRANPDVAASGIDPYRHFIKFGQYEGRPGAPPKLECCGSFDKLDPSLKTVLVVTHEATRSGVPVLSLNIIRELKKKFNVIALMLDAGTGVEDGPLTEDFRRTPHVFIKPVAGGRVEAVASDIIGQLIEKCEISFAIVNSIESRWVLKGLAANSIPAITLVHEFTTYTRPQSAVREVSLWSSAMVFSAPVVYQDAISEYPEIEGGSLHVIPQGRCVLPSPGNVEKIQVPGDEKARKALQQLKSDERTVIVLGAGSVHMRKGVDLFLDCAARVLQAHKDGAFHFVWIGKGFDPENDTYSLYLADQVRRAGLQRHVSFLQETSNIEAVYKTADMMLITSRLDPLPNVAIDAMAHGMPVVCFDRTTGIADFLKANGLDEECVVPYLDTAEMAAKTLTFVRSKELRQSVGCKAKELVNKEFDMERYVEKLAVLGMTSLDRLHRERIEAEEIGRSQLLSMDFLMDSTQKGMERFDIIHSYMRSWASGISLRKPFPGFHPGIYMEQMKAAADMGDPLAHYLRQGQPEGPWRYEVIRHVDKARPLPEGARVALHVHVYYQDLFPEILQRLNSNTVRPDLLISAPSERVASDISAALNGYSGRVVEVKIVPNRGRDIGPFLTAFGPTIVSNYDVVGHVHTKKSPHCPDAALIEAWRLFLLENLLGGASRIADAILDRMFSDPSIGMVFPDDPGANGWDKNRSYAEPFKDRLGLTHLPTHFLFPIGSMFWARVDALRPLFELDLDWNDYPIEPIHHDGTVLHALERLFGILASRQPFRLVATSIPGISR